MIAYCLADFFNLRLWKRHVQPSYADIRGGLEDLVAGALGGMREAQIQVRELNVRLYGGWYGDDTETRVPLRDITSAVIRDFPRYAGPRVIVQLADTPIWDRSLRLLRTIRAVPVKPQPGRLMRPSACADAVTCTVPAVIHWWRGRCPTPSCNVTMGDLGSTERQKMVDTLLVADTMSLLHAKTADVLLIASDDADIVPALLAIGVSKKPAIWLRRTNPSNKYYDGILTKLAVSTYTW